MLKRFITKVVEGKDLTEKEAYQAMNTIVKGKASPTQIASFLTGLRMKGETVKEITGFAFRPKIVNALWIRAGPVGMEAGPSIFRLRWPSWLLVEG